MGLHVFFVLSGGGYIGDVATRSGGWVAVDKEGTKEESDRFLGVGNLSEFFGDAFEAELNHLSDKFIKSHGLSYFSAIFVILSEDIGLSVCEDDAEEEQENGYFLHCNNKVDIYILCKMSSIFNLN